MKPIILMVVGALAGAMSALPQSSPEIDRALTAAPQQMREGATVIKWKSDYTYETLKKGTNRLVCYDRSGEPGRQPFAVQCTSIANLDRVAQNRKFEAITDKAQRQAAIEAAEKDGSRVKPEFGSVWIHEMGQDAEHTRKHITVAVPGATGQSLGVPESGAEGSIWVMNPGTTTAHLMIPEN